MAYTNADEWLEQFAAAGCRLRVDAGGLSPAEDGAPSDACREMWSELQGDENKANWDQVVEEVRRRVGPITGWAHYPS